MKVNLYDKISSSSFEVAYLSRHFEALLLKIPLFSKSDYGLALQHWQCITIQKTVKTRKFRLKASNRTMQAKSRHYNIEFNGFKRLQFLWKGTITSNLAWTVGVRGEVKKERKKERNPVTFRAEEFKRYRIFNWLLREYTFNIIVDCNVDKTD